ncbi:M28 family metallopeptidase [Anaerosalibacter sp. Marseille-P3206]|uniref:M28 family metallopeptidase n=1 Tax=Anaerosalibacter sp. Marseille-P3206 TaxID=1871005 RepID=UPI00098606E4|nr:M28 family peptidase [Anaerosalibacter sp. Marseille-P3206]
MIRNKKHITILALTILLLLTLLLTSCSNTNNKYKTTKESMIYLTSDECEGRRQGTPGNELALDYALTFFKKIGLKPYEGSYYFKFEKPCVEINEENSSMKVFTDKDIIAYEYGNDFIENVVSSSNYNIDVKSKLSDNCNDNTCAILTKDNTLIRNKDIKTLIILNEEKRGCIPFPTIDDRNIFLVSKQVYEDLCKNIGNEIHISIDGNVENKEQNHGVGMIAGDNNSAAIVINAHIDHVGSAGNYIWRGALDNASGVSSLLHIAEKLSHKYSDEKPPVDIIFCISNSEEVYEKYDFGISNFANHLQDKYSNVYNINLDCIGQKTDDKEIVIFPNEISDELFNDMAQSLSDFFIENGLKAVVKENYYAEQACFKNGLLISTITDKDFSQIHVLDDTIDRIDFEYLYNTADAIGEFLIKYLDEENLNIVSFSNISNKQIDKIMNEEEKALDFGQLKIIDIDGSKYQISNNTQISTLDEFTQKFELNLNSYPDSKLTLVYNPGIYLNKLQINEVHEFDTNINNVNYIILDDYLNTPIYFHIIRKDNLEQEKDLYRNCISDIQDKFTIDDTTYGVNENYNSIVTKNENEEYIIISMVELKSTQKYSNTKDIAEYLKTSNTHDFIQQFSSELIKIFTANSY